MPDLIFNFMRGNLNGYISQTFNGYFHHVSNAGNEFGLLLKYRSITT